MLQTKAKHYILFSYILNFFFQTNEVALREGNGKIREMIQMKILSKEFKE